MTNEELVKLLRAIRALALVPYPFSDPLPTPEPRAPLVFALGTIAGIVEHAIEKHEEALRR
jgi:hypothetical protein